MSMAPYSAHFTTTSPQQSILSFKLCIVRCSGAMFKGLCTQLQSRGGRKGSLLLTYSCHTKHLMSIVSLLGVQTSNHNHPIDMRHFLWQLYVSNREPFLPPTKNTLLMMLLIVITYHNELIYIKIFLFVCSVCSRGHA